MWRSEMKVIYSANEAASGIGNGTHQNEGIWSDKYGWAEIEYGKLFLKEPENFIFPMSAGNDARFIDHNEIKLQILHRRAK
jgi:hypothetical protein